MNGNDSAVPGKQNIQQSIQINHATWKTQTDKL